MRQRSIQRAAPPIGPLVLGLALAASASLCPQASAGPGDDKSYRAGIGLLGRGLNDLAAAELRTFLKDNPGAPEAMNARYSLAVCLVRLGKSAEAATELEPVLAARDFEFAPDALLLRAQCAAATGDDAGAADVLGRLVAGYPKFGQLDRATAMLGESLYRLGRIDEAVPTLAGLIEKWPNSPMAERAGLFAAMGELALRRFDAAGTRAAALRAKAPGGEYSSNLALIEAQCRHQQGDLANAAKLYELAANAPTGHAGQSGQAVRAEALLGTANVARARGDLPAAVKALAEAAKTTPGGELRERLALEQGKVLLDQGKPDAAMKVFAQSKASENEALGAEAAYWCAKCEMKQGKTAEAIERLARTATKFPKSDLVADMLFDRATLLAKAGKDQAALDAWEQWRGRFGESELGADALIAQAWCAHRLGKHDATAELCRTLEAKFPKRAGDESAAILIAENEFAAGRFEPALAAYTDLLQKHPQTNQAWRSNVRRGLCLVNLGRNDEADALLNAALAAPGEHDASLRRAAMTAVADRAFTKRDWARSEAWFAKLAEESSGDGGFDALLRQGISIERQGRFADAVPIFDRLIKAAPGSTQALHASFERGQSLIELGKLDEARKAMENVVATEKGELVLTPHAQRHLATIAGKQGRHEDAAAILAKLGQSAPGTDADGSGDAKIELGGAWLRAGKYAEAEKAFAEFLASNASAPRTLEVRARLAIAINRQGRHADAIKQLDALGDFAVLDEDTRASARYERALALRSLGKDAEAAHAYRELLADPTPALEAYAALDLAQIESKAEHYEAALKLAERGLAVADRGTPEAPASAALRERGTYLRAACLLRMGKNADAADGLKDFASTYPKSPMLASVALLRGEALLGTGQAKAAAEEFAKASESPDAGDIRAVATLRLGEARAACQDWPSSEKAYAAFIERNPSSELWFQARFGQAWALENQGQHDRAIEAYREIVTRHKGATAARAQFQIGECLYAQKKYELAASELLKTDVLFDYPEWSAAAVYEAGRCLAELGRSEDSARQFDDVVKRFPNTRWAELAKQRLEAKANAPTKSRAPVEAR